MITVEHKYDHSIITILDNNGKTDDAEGSYVTAGKS